MASATDNPLGRRRFLRGAAVSAAALVTKGAPVAAEPQQPGSEPQQPGSRAAPSTPPTTQLAADTEAPRRAAAPRIIERPGSDFMLDVIKSLGFEYVAANPGSSFEGLHESIINYGSNSMPELLTCCHEESSVAMAHGYAKIEGKPMLALVHGNIGIQHASMAVYNAYADRVPVFMIAGNWRDAGNRPNGVNSYHSAQDMALIVRDYVKWDDEPGSLTAYRRVDGARLQDRDDAADGAGADRHRSRHAAPADGRGAAANPEADDAVASGGRSGCRARGGAPPGRCERLRGSTRVGSRARRMGSCSSWSSPNCFRPRSTVGAIA